MKPSNLMNELTSLVKTVSIVVPVYNVEPYLRECLDSVRAQTFSEWECICVNDGSTDGSPAILAEYAEKDPRFRIIHQPNGGLSAARNTGMDAATGTFLYFLDSDDMLTPDAVERLHGHSETQRLDQVLFGAQLLVEPGAATEDYITDMRRYYSISDDIAGREMSGVDLFSALVNTRSFFASVPLRFFRRSSLPGTLRFPEGIFHEDNFFSPLALLAAKRVEVLADKFYRRRVRSGSIMTAPGVSDRHAKDFRTVYRLLGKSERLGWVPREAQFAFSAYRRELYRMHLDRLPRKRNPFARLIDIQRVSGTRMLLRIILRKLSGR